MELARDCTLTSSESPDCGHLPPIAAPPRTAFVQKSGCGVPHGPQGRARHRCCFMAAARATGFSETTCCLCTGVLLASVHRVDARPSALTSNRSHVALADDCLPFSILFPNNGLSISTARFAGAGHASAASLGGAAGGVGCADEDAAAKSVGGTNRCSPSRCALSDGGDFHRFSVASQTRR